jgi:hypothetical protein
MIDLEIKTIPHKKQRYETAGDWFSKKNRTYLRISECKDIRYEWLLAIHELVEKALCDINGIKEKDVDSFDLDFSGEGEPGDNASAPYRNEHCYATAVERMLCAAMNVSWSDYDSFVGSL